MTFALIIKVYCCLKQHSDLTEILNNKKSPPNNRYLAELLKAYTVYRGRYLFEPVLLRQ